MNENAAIPRAAAKCRLLFAAAGIAAAGTALAAGVCSTAGRQSGCPANPSVAGIQRTMKALEGSTAESPATVRVLFYGQSITAQGWTKLLMDNLAKRYPTVDFVWENRAIGGYESPSLIKTAETDLYPFYPDILFFHVYGPLDKYEEIVRRVRERTTAEIVLWTSHLRREESPVQKLQSRDERSRRILEIAERYGCLVVDLNRKWSEMMVGRGYTMDDLLADIIHMKKDGPALPAYAAFIAGELVDVPGMAADTENCGTVEVVPADDGRVARGADGSISLSFAGNRVVAVSDGAGDAGATAEVLLDGRPAAEFAEMYANTRPSSLVNWMPMVKLVTRREGAMPVAEDWTLEYVEGTQEDGQKIHYRLEGSVTGPDGEGWSDRRFVSRSGRAVIEPDDFHVWQYSYAKGKEHYEKAGRDKAKVGDKVVWKTVKLFADPYASAPARTQTVLVQNCANARHVLTLRPRGGALGIGAFVVYAPSKKFAGPGRRVVEMSVPEIEREIGEAAAECGRRQAALTDGVALTDYSALCESRGGTNVWTRALQKALDEHEVVRIPASDDVYYLDATVVVPSNRRIEASGATVRLVDGMTKILMRNANTPDGTLSPVPPGARDDNIAIVGGRWEDNCTVRAGYGRTGTYDAGPRAVGSHYGVSALFYFGNLNHLTVRDATFFHCGGFAVQAGDVDSAAFERIRFDRCFADGLHLNGNVSRVLARDVRGQVGDDIVALNAYDWLNSSVNFGPQRLIQCEDLELEEIPGFRTYPAIRIQPAKYRYADGSVVDCSISDVVFRRVKGVFCYKMYLQTPSYKVGGKREWAEVGSGGNLHFEDLDIDLKRPIDMIGGYKTSDPLRGHFAAFEFGANLSSLYFKNVDVTFHLDEWPLSHLVAVGPKSCRHGGTPDDPKEIFDPYVSCEVGKVAFENVRVRGDAPSELVHATVFDDVNRDGESSGRGVIREISGISASTAHAARKAGGDRVRHDYHSRLPQ